jgi:malonyl-CoA/methylmalonyl-CoA synthetase
MEAAVFGIASDAWGDRVASVVSLNPENDISERTGAKWGVIDMRRALAGKLAAHKIPQKMSVVDKIPKNAMGKGKRPKFITDMFACHKLS